MFRCFLTITGKKGVAKFPYKGCGAYGNGKTEDEARKVAKRYLRDSFGSGLKFEETMEEVDGEAPQDSGKVR